MIDDAISLVSTRRGELGALSNRLTSTIANLDNIAVNLSSARGRIQDTDFATETSNLAKSQIMQQAATAMLAQANASKGTVLDTYPELVSFLIPTSLKLTHAWRIEDTNNGLQTLSNLSLRGFFYIFFKQIF